MVFGFLHFGIVWPFYFSFKKHFNFVLLTIASVVPDLEPPTLFLLTGGKLTRLVLHSFAGSILLGFPIALFFGFIVFPKIYKRFQGFFERYFNTSLFNEEMKIISWKTFNSIALGLLTHAIIDVFMLHGGEGSPLLYPFSDERFIFSLFGNELISAIVLTIFAIIPIIYFSRHIIKIKQ